MLIDTHTHLNFNAFKEDGPDAIDRALQENIWMINIGSQLTSSQRAVKIASDYKKGVYAAVGLHPIHLYEIEVDEFEAPFKTRQEEFNKAIYKELAQNPKVVAIGETGLDYFRMPEGSNPEKIKKQQKDVFCEQLTLAKELAKPVTIHCRGSKDDPLDAYLDIVSILSEFSEIKGVIHCFSGSWEIAKKFLDLGFYISFTGIVTFQNAKDIQSLVQKIPLEKILLETDAPYLAPEPMRGKRNEPAFVKYVAEKIAELKKINFEEVAEVTTKSAKEFFKIS